MTTEQPSTTLPLIIAVASAAIVAMGFLALGVVGDAMDPALVLRFVIGLGAAIAAVVLVTRRAWWLVAGAAALTTVTPVAYSWSFALLPAVVLAVLALRLGVRTRAA